MSNVIQFSRGVEIPSDLMTLEELCEAYGFKYSFLYKWSVLAHKKGDECITPYNFGRLKLSLSDVINFMKKRGEKKYGGNQQTSLQN